MTSISENPINYDESQAGAYSLPDPFIFSDGRQVKDAAGWRPRRAEILHFFAEHMYGMTPDRPVEVQVEHLEQQSGTLNGMANRQQVRLTFYGNQHTASLDLLVYLPAHAQPGKPAALLPGAQFQRQPHHSRRPGHPPAPGLDA